MSRLDQRYPHARRLPASNTPADDATLLKLLQPYLGWVLAEIDTGSLDILICDSDSTDDGKPQHLVLLTGRAVAVWLRNAASNIDDFTPDDKPAQ